MGDSWSRITAARARLGRLAASGQATLGRVAALRQAKLGQSLVEFALALPVFLLLTLGVVDFARIYSAHISLTDGVRKAALYAGEWTDVGGPVANSTYWCTGVVSPVVIACPTLDLNGNAVSSSGHTKGDPDNIAYQLRSTGLDPARITLRAPGCGATAPYTASPCSADQIVTITATYRETILTPIIGSILGGSITMAASTSARVMRSQ